MKITFAKQNFSADGITVCGVYGTSKLSDAAKELDKKSKGFIKKAMKDSENFTGKFKQVLVVPSPNGMKASHLILFGLGKKTELNEEKLCKLGGAIFAATQKLGTEVTIYADDIDQGTKMAEGLKMRSYRFDKYKTKLKASDKPKLKTATFMLDDFSAAKKVFDGQEQVVEGVFTTRDVVNEPANVLYPESLAERARGLKKLGVKVDVLDEKKMEKLGMGALLGVGQGSAFESKLIVMEYKGNPKAKDKRPVAFVGKGVTFDTGGISIKPAANMDEMKGDMAGSGAVLGLMHALAARKAKVNVVCVIGAVENMPSSTAQRPGDIVKSMSGQTIEVLNTDAEGRLVLADALWYTQDKYDPQYMIDLATLTGAVVVALGREYAGLMSNDDKLANMLFETSKKVGEKLWQLPLDDAYDKAINSPIADVQNIAKNGTGAGTITAAHFLKRFVNKTKWAHLDIAAVEWSKSNSDLSPIGATGFGVRLLDRFIRDNFEG